MLIAVSSSGRSPNIVRAVEWAYAHGMRDHRVDWILRADLRGSWRTCRVHVESDNYGIIEDAHQACMHLLAQYVRQSQMTPTQLRRSIF